MDIDPIDVLDRRITTLEERILGSQKITDVKKPLADSVFEINNQVSTALSQRDSINSIMKRMDQLEDFLDPMYGDRAVLTADAKMELVLASEPQLRENLANLEFLGKAQTALNSEHIRAVPDLSGKLEQLTLLYLDKKEKVDAQTAEVHQLLQKYNDIVMSLSKSFVQCDQLVTEREIAAKPKKRLD